MKRIMFSRKRLCQRVICDSRRCYTNKENLLPEPTWSLNDLQLSTRSVKHVVTEKDVEALCKLSCVDLAKSCTSVQSVVNDINVILRCAESIKGKDWKENKTNEERLFTDRILTMQDLRDDVADDINYKTCLLTKPARRFGDYFSVPNVNSSKKIGKK